MLLQILIHVPARYLYEESPVVVVVFLEDDRREPCSELLLGDVALDELKAVVPKRLWIISHAAIVVLLISYTNVRLIMISFAKFAIIFEICKSVFLISKHSKACNSLVYRALERFGLFLNNMPSCINATF